MDTYLEPGPREGQLKTFGKNMCKEIPGKYARLMGRVSYRHCYTYIWFKKIF